MRTPFNRRAVTTAQVLLVNVLLGLAWPPAASAHKGPPFPILMDEPAAGYVISVWTDPDIGVATFYVIVETPQGKPPRQTLNVSMWVQPTSGRLEPVTYHAKKLSLRNQLEFQANPYFDQGDMWNLGFRITASNGETQELTAKVESTPPGFGAWNLVIYIFPFLLLGGFWVMAMRRRRRIIQALHERAESESKSLPQENEELVRSEAEHGA
jgi:hypothetical protein